MESDGTSGIEETLPGTMLSDIKRLGMPYGIYVNPYTGYMYATDAGSFAAAGSLIQWSPEGKLLGKHKVYINPAHILALPPNGDFSGIEEIVNDQQPSANAIYDIFGRKVETPQKGKLYIMNRKKIIL